MIYSKTFAVSAFPLRYSRPLSAPVLWVHFISPLCQPPHPPPTHALVAPPSLNTLLPTDPLPSTPAPKSGPDPLIEQPHATPPTPPPCPSRLSPSCHPHHPVHALFPPSVAPSPGLSAPSTHAGLAPHQAIALTHTRQPYTARPVAAKPAGHRRRQRRRITLQRARQNRNVPQQRRP